MEELVRGQEQRVAGRLMRSREKWQSAPIVRPPTGRQPPIQGCWVGHRCCSRAPTAPPPRRLKKAVLARQRTRSTASWRFDVAPRAPGSRILVEPRAPSLSALTTSARGDAGSALITYHNSPPSSAAGSLPEAEKPGSADHRIRRNNNPIAEERRSALRCAASASQS